MKINRNMFLAFAALATYIVGGAFVFSGVALMIFARGEDLLGWGDGQTVGYAWIVIGLILSILGILLARVCRNRGLLGSR